jgi:hypothetical protein
MIRQPAGRRAEWVDMSGTGPMGDWDLSHVMYLDVVKVEHVALPEDFQVKYARGIHVFVYLMVSMSLVKFFKRDFLAGLNPITIQF